jgi:KipI family sensor histidine kinase inhibitor
MTISPDLRPAGERAVLVELPGNATVRKLAPLVRRALAGIEEVVAGHETLLISWEPGRRPPVDLADRLQELLSGPSAQAEASAIEIPVVYDGPDLALVATACELSPEEVVRRHLEARFEVGFIGFAPGFAYLLGGDPALRPPRRPEPRERVPARSLAIAGEYSAVYPGPSPGGWNLIGTAQVDPFVAEREPAALLRTGMHVRFVEAS